MTSKILVVDDAKFARKMIIKALNNAGYDNIVEATTAAETLEVFQKEDIELTLLDITLPDNSDLTLLKKLLEIKPDAKIIMNSAIGQALIITDALALGAKNFITKPFVESEFINIVKNVIEND